MSKSNGSKYHASNNRNQGLLEVALVGALMGLRLLRVLLGLHVLHDLADVVPLRRRQREQPRVVAGLVDGLLALQQLRTGRPER